MFVAFGESKPNFDLYLSGLVFSCKVICRKIHIPVRWPKWPPRLIFAGTVTKRCYEHVSRPFSGIVRFLINWQEDFVSSNSVCNHTRDKLCYQLYDYWPNWTPLSPIFFIACMLFFCIRMAILKRTTFGGFAFSVYACNCLYFKICVFIGWTQLII